MNHFISLQLAQLLTQLPRRENSTLSPTLAARLVELEACGLEYEVIITQPDLVVLLVTNGDPGPFLLTVSIDNLPKTEH